MNAPRGVAQAPSSRVATPDPDLGVDSRPCAKCGRQIPRPRRGQKACSPACRWALWNADQQADAASLEDALALIRQAAAILEGPGDRMKQKGKRPTQPHGGSAGTLSLLPMEIQIGDRFTEGEFEWEVVTH